jgi:hypothetical protein
MDRMQLTGKLSRDKIILYKKSSSLKGRGFFFDRNSQIYVLGQFSAKNRDLTSVLIVRFLTSSKFYNEL